MSYDSHNKIDNWYQRLCHFRMFYKRMVMVACLLLLIFCQSRWPSNSWELTLMKSIAVLSLAIAAMGRCYCILFIGGQKNTKVVDVGPYSVVRNPLYLCSFFGILGIGLYSGMLSITLLLLLLFIAYYPFVLAGEQEVLKQLFGESYQQYCMKTPVWLPKWKIWNCPKQISFNTKSYLKNMCDSSLLFGIIPLVNLLDYLHQTKILIAICQLY